MYRYFFLAILVVTTNLTAAEPVVWWSDAVEVSLEKAADNQAELIKALKQVPANQRAGMAFLVEHMPIRDLTSLTGDFLLENVAYAYQARSDTEWGRQIPESIFLNDVLPYANVNEARDQWRKDFYERFAPIVADCQSAAAAGQRLNERMFQMLGVKYSTRRNRADQGPTESIRSGLASCTGLSILLANACRSVGVPARLAGIPSWVNKRGNHTWVEIWDGEWHFTGAAEPSSKGLNHAWFQHDASLANASQPRHSIFASSFRSTGLSFPMVWDRHNRDVPAVNVTRRYTSTTDPNAKPKTRLLVRVFDTHLGTRMTADVKVTSDSLTLSGTSRNESFDTNDILAFELPRRSTFRVAVGDQQQQVETGDEEQVLVDFRLVAKADELPIVFTEDFEKGHDRWETTDDTAWHHKKVDGNHVFGLNRRTSNYQPKVRSPHNIALIKDLQLADFEITFRVTSTLDTGGHRDCCVFFCHQDPTHFYYVHLGANPDPHSGQIMLVNDKPRAALTKNENRTPWDDDWHRVKVIRDSQSGKIEIYFDDMETPHMSVVDKTFGKGRIGIGSFDDMNDFDDVQIRGR